MATAAVCPTCSRKLRVPDDLAGKRVKCPSCGTNFQTNGTAAEAEEEERQPAPRRPPAPAVVEEDEPQPAPRRRPSRDDDYDDEPEYGGRGRRRRRYAEHRGTLILVLGVLSLLPHGVGWVLGPIAWILGNNDIKEIREGRMDPEGESSTNAGRICGMVSTILHVAGLLIGCVIVIIWFVAFAAIAGAAAGAH